MLEKHGLYLHVIASSLTTPFCYVMNNHDVTVTTAKYVSLALRVANSLAILVIGLYVIISSSLFSLSFTDVMLCWRVWWMQRQG